MTGQCSQEECETTGKINDAFQTKDSGHASLAAGPWLALRLRLGSVETLGSFSTMRHKEERTQAAGRTRAMVNKRKHRGQNGLQPPAKGTDQG